MPLGSAKRAEEPAHTEAALVAGQRTEDSSSPVNGLYHRKTFPSCRTPFGITLQPWTEPAPIRPSIGCPRLA